MFDKFFHWFGCELPSSNADCTNNDRLSESIFYAFHFVDSQSGEILSLISLLSLMWGNNLVSSNPITEDFPPQEWAELKFHCVLEDSDSHTHDISDI